MIFIYWFMTNYWDKSLFKQNLYLIHVD